MVKFEYKYYRQKYKIMAELLSRNVVNVKPGSRNVKTKSKKIFKFLTENILIESKAESNHLKNQHMSDQAFKTW